MLTIRHYKIFSTVAKCGSMSEAAKQLYISQPTVSQTILEIEKHYDVKLFERYPKRLYITIQGKYLLDFVNPMIYAFDNVVDLTLHQMSTFKIRIGATYTVSACILNDIIEVSKKQDNALDFHISVDNTRKIEQMLLNNDLDFAIIDGIIKNKDIITMPIADDCLVLVCGNKHPFAKEKKVTLAQLNNQDFILREEGSGTRKLLESEMTLKHISYNIKWECSSLDAVKNAVINNHGLAIISARLIREELDNGKLYIVPVKECMWQRDIFLCYHKNKSMNKEFKPFMNAVIAYHIDGVKCPVMEGKNK